MKMCLNHVILEWIVVVSLVEQWVYAPSVNLQLAMVNHLAWYRYWQRGCNLLAVVWKKQCVQSSVVNNGFQRPIKQVCLEVDDYVVLVLNQIPVGSEVNDEFRIPNNFVFSPLGQFLRKGYGEIRLVQPHGHV